jgi:Lar family restriction alleviation protein
MSNPLKPCPFCGGDGAVAELFEAGDWLPSCRVCGVTGRAEASREAAIAAWNHRPAEDALRAEMEQVRAERYACEAAWSEALAPLGIEPGTPPYEAARRMQLLLDGWIYNHRQERIGCEWLLAAVEQIYNHAVAHPDVICSSPADPSAGQMARHVLEVFERLPGEDRESDLDDGL